MPESPAAPELDRDAVVLAVRAALASPGADVLDWTVQRLHGSASPTAGGVFRVAGTARTAAGSGAWSLVLKNIVARPGFEDPAHDQYWKREALAYGSGFFEALPTHAPAARCFAVQEPSGGAVRLWLEDLGAPADWWTLDELAGVVRHLGRLAAACPEEILPPHPWFSRGWLRAWVSHGATAVRLLSCEEQMALVLDPATYRHPVLAAAYPRPVAPRMRRLWEHRDLLLGKLEALPRALFHGDADQRNAFHRPGGAERTTLIDWSFVGLAAVGEEIGHTGGLRAAYEDATAEVERLVMGAYLDGLRAGGWAGDPRAVRFAADAHMALRWAFRWTANAVLVANEPAFAAQGWDPEGTASWAARVAYHALDCGDRALEALAVL